MPVPIRDVSEVQAVDVLVRGRATDEPRATAGYQGTGEENEGPTHAEVAHGGQELLQADLRVTAHGAHHRIQVTTK